MYPRRLARRREERRVAETRGASLSVEDLHGGIPMNALVSSRFARRHVRVTLARDFAMLAILSLGRTASANCPPICPIDTNGITVEAVSDYSLACGDHHCDTNYVTEVDNFASQMVNSGLWSDPGRYYDNNVWDRDMEDPDVSGDPNDDDYGSLDPQAGYNATQTALAMFGAHGSCEDLQGAPTCSSSLDCGNTSPGHTDAGFCPTAPPNAIGPSRCIYNKPGNITTSSTFDTHSHYGWYGHPDSTEVNAKWGEDPISGTWANSGTNGDLNVLFIHNSCGTRFPGFPLVGNLANAVGGVGLLNFIAPNSFLQGLSGQPVPFADAVAWSGWGGYLAGYALMQPDQAIATAWSNTFWVHAPTGMSEGCPNVNADFTYGGGHGLQGCGSILSISFDSSGTGATSKISMTWNQAQAESTAVESSGTVGWEADFYRQL
jgi:hypothetical protein